MKRPDVIARAALFPIPALDGEGIAPPECRATNSLRPWVSAAFDDGRHLSGCRARRAATVACRGQRCFGRPGGRTVIKIWSEMRGERLKEQIADVATLAWTFFWASIAWELFQFLASFAQGGRTIRAGGQSVIQGGRDLGELLAGLPLVGSQLRDKARDTFADLGHPLSEFGTDVERFIVVVAVVLALILALVTMAPWLSRYLPWRWKRLRGMRAAHRAVQMAARVPGPALEHALALRAITRLDYQTLFEYTPDPLGDWATARHDRLARAELASVGLRPLRTS